jgi:hypothetical protein
VNTVLDGRVKKFFGVLSFHFYTANLTKGCMV